MAQNMASGSPLVTRMFLLLLNYDENIPGNVLSIAEVQKKSCNFTKWKSVKYCISELIAKIKVRKNYKIKWAVDINIENF